jgi:hypothetical protein
MDDPIKFCLDQAEQTRRKANEPTPLQHFYSDLEARWLMYANRLDLTPT